MRVIVVSLCGVVQDNVVLLAPGAGGNGRSMVHSLPEPTSRPIFLSMCTAYEIGSNGNRLPARVKISAVDTLSSFGETRIVRPTLFAPVIMPDGELREMSWGFRRKFRGVNGPVSRTIVNSREDKLGSAMWREAFRERRCLIPAISFYEWVEGAGGKVPLRFTRADDGWVLIAGIWEGGENGPCYSMLTTEPSACVQQHHDRMPAVLAEEQIDPYLDGDLREFGPSSVALQHITATNFLKPAPPPSDGEHETLF